MKYTPEPFIGRPNQTGQIPLDILDIVELGRKRILDIDNDNFPVRLAFVEEGHDT
jgi:hypothetical protein